MFTAGGQYKPSALRRPVRVSASGTTFVAQVTAVSDERLDLSDGTRAWSIAFSGMSRLERSTGTRSRWRQGLAFGAATGAVGGVILGLGFGTACTLVTLGFAAEECGATSLELTLIAGAALAAAGGLAGMGIGALFRTETWTPIPFSDRKIEYMPTIQPRVGPDGGLGLSFGARIRFGVTRVW